MNAGVNRNPRYRRYHGPYSVIGLYHQRGTKKIHDRSIFPGILSHRVFRFGDRAAPSMGMIEIILDTLYGVQPIRLVMDIVDVNIQPFLGLDDMDGHGLLAGNATKQMYKCTILSCRSHRGKAGWSLRHRGDQNHLCAQMLIPRYAFYTMKQLRKLHKKYAHLSAGNLYN